VGRKIRPFSVLEKIDNRAVIDRQKKMPVSNCRSGHLKFLPRGAV
jgi:hypothetical protein